MNMWQRFLIFAVGLGLFLGAMQLVFATERSSTITSRFRAANACPSTGKFIGPCPGWIMDHMKPLRCGGPDSVENIMWQTIEEAKAKDRTESQCWRWYRGSNSTR